MAPDQTQGLIKGGFTKVTCPYGIIVAGDPTYPDSMINYASNTIANIIDPTGTGTPWWEDARKYWSAWGGNVLAGGATKELEDPCDSLGDKGWPYCFKMKTWNVSVPEDQSNTDDMAEYFKQS